jgi:hypothetical protein
MRRLDRSKRQENGPAVPEGCEHVGEQNGVGMQGRREKWGGFYCMPCKARQVGFMYQTRDQEYG